MNVPLSRFLTSFSEPSLPPLEMRLPVAVAEVRMTQDELDDRLSDIRREVEARYESEIDLLRATHEQALTEQLAAARSEWCETEGALLSVRLDNAVAALKDELAIDIAGALMPLLADAAVSRAQIAVLTIVDTILKDSKHLVLRGRADLLDAIRRARPDASNIDYVPSDDTDIVLEADECRIETRLGLALAALTPTEV